MASEVLRSFGKLQLQVRGWSMFPSVQPGDTLIVDRAPAEAVAEGDIVLFGRNSRFFAHRVVKKSNGAGKTGMLTRGDAMIVSDPPVGENELLGRVSFIVRNGRLFEPNKSLRLSERLVAILLSRSEIAARVVVGIHGLRHT
jgi:signal peptidase I